MPRAGHQRRFGGTRSAPRLARRWATPHLLALGLDGSSSDALIVLTELVTNAVVHGEGPIEVHLFEVHAGVRIEVSDQGEGWPRVCLADDLATGGRGLLIVDRVAASWGVRPEARGKTVFAEVAT